MQAALDCFVRFLFIYFFYFQNKTACESGIRNHSCKAETWWNSRLPCLTSNFRCCRALKRDDAAFFFFFFLLNKDPSQNSTSTHWSAFSQRVIKYVLHNSKTTPNAQCSANPKSLGCWDVILFAQSNHQSVQNADGKKRTLNRSSSVRRLFQALCTLCSSDFFPPIKLSGKEMAFNSLLHVLLRNQTVYSSHSLWINCPFSSRALFLR